MQLAALDNQCELHQSFDVCAELTLFAIIAQFLNHFFFQLMEGRRASGGKLELKVRIRDPLSGKKQVEEMKEKWLVIDRFERAAVRAAAPAASAPKFVHSTHYYTHDLPNAVKKNGGAAASASECTTLLVAFVCALCSKQMR